MFWLTATVSLGTSSSWYPSATQKTSLFIINLFHTKQTGVSGAELGQWVCQQGQLLPVCGVRPPARSLGESCL